MAPLGNDRWRGSFEVRGLAAHVYTVAGFVDHFRTWRRDLGKKARAAHGRAGGPARGRRARGRGRRARARRGREGARRVGPRAPAARRPPAGGSTARSTRSCSALVDRYPDRAHEARFPLELQVSVDRERARFSAWYELFPRSTGPQGPARHVPRRREAACRHRRAWASTCSTCRRSTRSGAPTARAATTRPEAGPGDVGSPWAIGAREGGHTAVHPAAGHARRLPPPRDAGAASTGLEIALDLAFQCSPDHPWVKEHPQWFRHAPGRHDPVRREPAEEVRGHLPDRLRDATTGAALWEALLERRRSSGSDQGVRIFRVDNPHTKPFRFWEWLIAEVHREHPDVDLPRRGLHAPEGDVPAGQARLHPVLHLLHLAQHEVGARRVPDGADAAPEVGRVLPAQLLAEHAGHPHRGPAARRPAGLHVAPGRSPPRSARATGSTAPPSSCSEPRRGTRGARSTWTPRSTRSGTGTCEPAQAASATSIARVNRIRRENPALQSNRSLEFHERRQRAAHRLQQGEPDDRANVVLVVVNLDPHHTPVGLARAAARATRGRRRTSPTRCTTCSPAPATSGTGARNFVELDPRHVPAHIFRLRRKVRTEHDFDYFL